MTSSNEQLAPLTTDVIGILTNIGIELGRRLYGRLPFPDGVARALGRGRKLQLLCTLAACFFIGGIAGTTGFHKLGYPATVPLALVLLGLASVPVADDLRARWRR